MEKMESLERWRNEKKIGQTKVSRGSQEEKRDNPSNHREKEGPKKGGARDLSSVCSVCRTVPWARDELGEPEQTQRHAQDRFVSVGKETNHRFRVQTYYKLSFTASARRGTER